MDQFGDVVAAGEDPDDAAVRWLLKRLGGGVRPARYRTLSHSLHHGVSQTLPKQGLHKSRCVSRIDVMESPRQCFLSYAHHDQHGFERLLANLKPYAHLYGIKLWYDRGIAAGSYWDDKIRVEIARSQIFVLLTTNDYLGSEYVWKHELPAIIEQHKKAKALVVPVIYRVCGWKGFFANYIQAIPKTPAGQLLPVMKWPDEEEALAFATEAISDAIQDWFGVPPPTSPLAFDRRSII